MTKCFWCNDKIRIWETSYVDTEESKYQYHTDCIIEKLEAKVSSSKNKINELERQIKYLTTYSGKKAGNMSFEEFVEKVDKGEIKKDEPTKTATITETSI